MDGIFKFLSIKTPIFRVDVIDKVPLTGQLEVALDADNLGYFVGALGSVIVLIVVLNILGWSFTLAYLKSIHNFLKIIQDQIVLNRHLQNNQYHYLPYSLPNKSREQIIMESTRIQNPHCPDRLSHCESASRIDLESETDAEPEPEPEMDLISKQTQKLNLRKGTKCTSPGP